MYIRYARRYPFIGRLVVDATPGRQPLSERGRWQLWRLITRNLYMGIFLWDGTALIQDANINDDDV
jgi:hypothetical protein